MKSLKILKESYFVVTPIDDPTFSILIGIFSLTASNTTFRLLQKRNVKWQLKLTGNSFFYRHLHTFFFPHPQFEELIFANTFGQNLLRFLYAIFTLLVLAYSGLLHWSNTSQSDLPFFAFNGVPGFLALLGLFLIFFILGDYLARIIGSHYPDMTLRIFLPLASFFLVLIFPITYLFLKLSRTFSKTIYFESLKDQSNQEARQELIDIIEESTISTSLDPHDKKLLTSVMAFKDRIAREVMVPRVDVFGLSHDTTIAEAANFLLNEGYSRTPVYKDTLDDIIGVLMYKDILSKYMEYVRTVDKKVLEAPIETLVKSVLYIPETKKISHLLQEFRKKQVHLAIIVDEYGGTEGIVTIEDILEEIVGDIADEYDEEEESLFLLLPEGGWLIDARMNIFDIKDQFDIEIPQTGDYDTIGGYIFHETGTIPGKGYIIRKPDFELEVLRSNDRRVEKLRIQAINPDNESEEFQNFSS